MAITRSQIAKQLLEKGGRVGLRFGSEGYQGGRTDQGGAGPGGRDRQASENRVSAATNIGSMQQAFGPNIGPKTKQQQDARDIIEAQRKTAIGEISPSTRLSNRIIGGALGASTPFGVGQFLFNKAVNQTAMGFNKPSIIVEDDNDDNGDGDQNIMLAQRFTPFQQDVIEETEEEKLSPIELALLKRGEARAFVADGGIMDLEQARQGYKLGKLVKKVTRGLKKIVKSPVGAAAVASFIPFGPKGDKTSLFKKFMDSDLAANIGSFLPDDPKDRFGLAAAAGLVAAPFIFGEDDTEDEYQKFLASRGSSGQGLDIQGIRNKPYDFLGRAFVAEGGKPEPVAKKTMPLLDMGGKEMDLRAEGGFVPIGRMEKADDVPARLSKNEFVFTADAVRNAGEGDVDKGAEVMYNMMKNLEAGGEVSEESQGLEGARKMFQTSQRLEEVL